MGILSNIGHFLFGGKANSQTKSATNQTTSQTSTRDPYAVGGSIQAILPQLQQLYAQSGISPMEQQGYDQVAATAASGNVDNAVAANNKVINGDYLSPETNPYLKAIADRVGGETLSKISAQFGGAGRTGSGLSGYYAGQGVSASINDLYNSNYQSERARQQQSIGMAGELDQSRYNGAQALISAGQNISARPYDLAGEYTDILAKIGAMGGITTGTGNMSGTSTGSSVGQAESSGIIGGTLKTFANSAASAAGKGAGSALFPA